MLSNQATCVQPQPDRPAYFRTGISIPNVSRHPAHDPASAGGPGGTVICRSSDAEITDHERMTGDFGRIGVRSGDMRRLRKILRIVTRRPGQLDPTIADGSGVDASFGISRGRRSLWNFLVHPYPIDEVLVVVVGVVSRGLLPACYPVTPPHALAVMDIPTSTCLRHMVQSWIRDGHGDLR